MIRGDSQLAIDSQALVSHLQGSLSTGCLEATEVFLEFVLIHSGYL
jgi:hypothetical protein